MSIHYGSTRIEGLANVMHALKSLIRNNLWIGWLIWLNSGAPSHSAPHITYISLW